MTSVAAIIPTLAQAPGRLRATVDAVLASRAPVDLAVIVVVNAGRSGASRGDASRGGAPLDLPEGVRVIEAGANLGWAGGLHLGRAVATADLLWLVQDDLVPDTACLSHLVAALEREAVDFVSPVVVDDAEIVDGQIVGGVVPKHALGGRHDPAVLGPTPGNAAPADTAPGGTAPVDRPDGSTGILLSRFPEHDTPLAELDAPEGLDYVPGRGALLRAATWDAVGGMDARNYPVGASDVELCLALAAAGRRFTIALAARATHERSASTPRPLARVVSRRNRQRAVATWRDGAARTPGLAAELPASVRDAVLVGATEAVAALALELEQVTRQRDDLREKLRRASDDLR